MAPELVLLHGFSHTGASWDPVVAALGERYRSLAPDLRGHGARHDAEPVTLSAQLDDLAALTPAAFSLAGYSMGGRIALQASLALPARVERLVLIGASPGIADEQDRTARVQADELLADCIEGSPIEEFEARWAAAPILGGQTLSVQRAAREDRLRNTPEGLARALRGLGTGALPSLWGRLGELRTPVTLIVGERDAKFRAIAERMTAAIAGAELVVVRGAGHAVHLERPERVAAVISES